MEFMLAFLSSFLVKHYSTKSEKATLIPSSYFADTSKYYILFYPKCSIFHRKASHLKIK